MNKATKQEIFSYIATIVIASFLTVIINSVFAMFEYSLSVYAGVTTLVLAVIGAYLYFKAKKQRGFDIAMLFLVIIAVAGVLQIVIGWNPAIAWRPEASFANITSMVAAVLIADVFADWLKKQVF